MSFPLNRGRSTGLDIQEEIHRLAHLGLGPSAIHKQLDQIEAFKGRVPHLQTVKTIVKEDVQPRDTSDPWSFAEAENPADGGLVLSVLAHVNRYSKGRITYLTRSEAKWIVRTRSACPDMLLHDVWDLTQHYVARETQGEDLHEIDLFLGYLVREREPSARLEPVLANTVFDLEADVIYKTELGHQEQSDE